MTETGDQVVLEAVQLINRLRRYLVDIARTWTAGLESMDEAKDVHVENVDERGPVHKTKASSESEGLNLLPELPTLMAPKLVDISLDSGHSSEDNSMQSDIIPAGLVAKYVSFFEDHESVPSEVTAERQTSTSRRPEAEATTIDLSQSQQDLQLQEFRSESLKRE